MTATDPRGETHEGRTDADGVLWCECGSWFRDSENFGTAEDRHADHVAFRMRLQP